MIHLDAYPGSFPDTAAAPGPANVVVVQKIRSCISDLSVAPVGGSTVASLSTQGLWHYPAVLTNTHNETIPLILAK